MAHVTLIEPKEVSISGKIYFISKIPAMDGLEILSKYSSSTITAFSKYENLEEVTLKLLSYVSVTLSDDVSIRLDTKDKVNSHVKSVWDILKLKKEMAEYNFDFFIKERASNFLGGIAQNIQPLVTKILTDSLEQLSTKIKQPSMNSEPSTV